MSPVVVLAAAIAGFVTSGIYYSILRDPLGSARADGAVLEPRPWIYGVEFVRTLVIAAVVAGVAAVADIESWPGGFALGL